MYVCIYVCMPVFTRDFANFLKSNFSENAQIVQWVWMPLKQAVTEKKKVMQSNKEKTMLLANDTEPSNRFTTLTLKTQKW